MVQALQVLLWIFFFVLWFSLSAFIVRAGWLAIRWRKITYRWPTPLGRMVVTMAGRGVVVIGALQIAIGVLLFLSLVTAALALTQVNMLVGTLFCLSIPLYALTARLLSRRLDVTSRHAWH
ncbi:MAG: hypothetical protein EA396_05060 [Anaerolineaceae bacterium]|nr:MAG: hypothetical protein EA396_05060 [Anaerolineaceae bacterium]